MDYERPKTSRGHRNSAEEQYIQQSYEPVSEFTGEKPLIRKSNRKSVFSNSAAERPSTGMGFYASDSSHNISPISTPNETSPKSSEDFAGRFSPQKERPSSGYFVSPRNERPKTGYGRRNSEVVAVDSLQSVNDGSESRPSTASRRARPKSAKGRTRPSYGANANLSSQKLQRERSLSLGDHLNIKQTSPIGSPVQYTESPRHGTRPASSLSLNKYNPLPSIGQRENSAIFQSPEMGIQREKTFFEERSQSSLSNTLNQTLTISTKSRFQEAKNYDTVAKQPTTENNQELRPLERQIVLPQEPNEDEYATTLAIKLPNGQRVQRRFKPEQTLQAVLEFAEISSRLDLSKYTFFTNTVPKAEFTDLNQTIKDSKLENRSLLFMQMKES